MKYLWYFLAWLGMVTLKEREVKKDVKIQVVTTETTPVCPKCRSLMEFTWADTDIHGYHEEVGCWICKCRKAVSMVSASTATNNILRGDISRRGI
jgi:hypothetical protein